MSRKISATNSRSIRDRGTYLVSFSIPRDGQAQGRGSPLPESRVLIGTALPMTQNGHVEITSGNLGVAPALWVQVASHPSDQFSVNLSAEIPASFKLQTRHTGSAAYVAKVEHRDFAILPLVGVRMPSTRRLQPVALMGVGAVFARTATTFTSFHFSRAPETGLPNYRNRVVAALAGGLDVEFRLNDRANFVARVHGRKAWRRVHQSDEVIGGFTISPGIGMQFRL